MGERNNFSRSFLRDNAKELAQAGVTTLAIEVDKNDQESVSRYVNLLKTQPQFEEIFRRDLPTSIKDKPSLLEASSSRS